MRPWFALRPAQPVQPRRDEIGAEEAAEAWDRAYAEARRHWPGGAPTRRDLACLTRAVARDLRVTAEALSRALEAARSTPL